MVDADRRDPTQDTQSTTEVQRIGVRELRQHASRWLQRVTNGESFEITDHGRPVALLSPLPEDESVIDKLLRTGQLRAPRNPGPLPEPVQLSGGPSVSEVLAEMRAEERY